MENAIRFMITDGVGHRAATRKIWTEKKRSCFYLLCREINNIMKVSFHEDGNWHVKRSREAIEKYFAGNNLIEHISKWVSLDPIFPGITFAFSIITPYSAVSTPISQLPKKIFQISNCKPGFATEILIFLVTSNESKVLFQEKNLIEIGTMPLENGELVYLAYQYTNPPDLKQSSVKQIKLFKGVTRSDLNKGSYKGLIFGEGLNGIRLILDLNITRDAIGI